MNLAQWEMLQPRSSSAAAGQLTRTPVLPRPGPHGRWRRSAPLAFSILALLLDRMSLNSEAFAGSIFGQIVMSGNNTESQ